MRISDSDRVKVGGGGEKGAMQAGDLKVLFGILSTYSPERTTELHLTGIQKSLDRKNASLVGSHLLL